jgi:hypothetical protein
MHDNRERESRDFSPPTIPSNRTASIFFQPGVFCRGTVHRIAKCHFGRVVKTGITVKRDHQIQRESVCRCVWEGWVGGGGLRRNTMRTLTLMTLPNDGFITSANSQGGKRRAPRYAPHPPLGCIPCNYLDSQQTTT